MNINKFDSFVELNEYLDKAYSNLKGSLEGKSVEQTKEHSALLNSIKNVMSHNTVLLKEGQPNDVVRFVKTVKQITQLEKNSEVGFLKEAFKIVAVSSNNLDTIKEFKEVDQDLYHESLANYLAIQKKPIKSLNLSEKEMLEIAPWLTYLDLTDGSNRQCEDCTFTEDFIGELLENSQNLKTLLIKNSKIEGKAFTQSLKGMQNLQELKIVNCYAFNQSLKKRPNLQKLIIERCPAFNQSLEGMQNLQVLRIRICRAFNQSLKEMQNLQELTIDYCPVFNQSLKGMQNLQELTIRDCPAFNQSLEGMQNLKELSIWDCDAFNQSLKGMQKLQELTIESCDAFNQSLEGMQNLQELTIVDCPAFKLTDFNTALLISRIKPKLFKELCNKLTHEAKKQFAGELLENREEMENIAKNFPEQLFPVIKRFEISEEEFLDLYPQYKMHFTLKRIDQLIRQGERGDVVQTQFSSLKDQENYLDCLKITIKAFPRLTSFLIQNLKEEVINDIKELHISFKDLSQESRMALLPLCPPDEIQKSILEVSQKERKQWLQQPLRFEQFSGTTEAVLKEIKERNLDHAKQEEIDSLLIVVRELFKKIPLKTLAAYASFDANTDVLLAYSFALEGPQMAVAIPPISENNLLSYLEAQSIKTHNNLLFYATSEQKEAYVDKDLLKYEPIQAWGKTHKPDLEKEMSDFHKDITEENYKKLDKLWNKIFFPTNTAVNEYALILKSLQKVLIKFSPSDEYSEKLKEYIEKKMVQVKEVKKELKKMGVKIEKFNLWEKKLPDEFIDDITGAPMTDPYTDKYGHILDKSTWDQLENNPYTKELLDENSISPDHKLKEKIDEFQQLRDRI